MEVRAKPGWPTSDSPALFDEKNCVSDGRMQTKSRTNRILCHVVGTEFLYKFRFRPQDPQGPTILPSLPYSVPPIDNFRMMNAWYNTHDQQDVGYPIQRVSRGTYFAYCHSPPHSFYLHQAIPVQLGQDKSRLNRMWTIPFKYRVALVQGPDSTMKRNARTRGLL